jgi:2-acylglycerol O-acyltransferase 2
MKLILLVIPFQGFLREVGRPIEVNKMSKATEEEVLRVQKLYIEELERIWNEWKDVYATDRITEFQVVE